MRLFLFIAILAGVTLAQAQTQGTDWQFADETDSVLNVPVCRAFTTKTDSVETVELSVVIPSDKKTLPMIRVQTKIQASLIQVDLPGDLGKADLIPVSTGADGSNVYWYVPKNFDQFEKLIRGQGTLALNFAQAKVVTIPLAGANDVIGQAEACFQGRLALSNFFGQLNRPGAKPADSTGDGTGSFLFQTTQTAYDHFQRMAAIQDVLTPIQAPVLSMLASEPQGRKLLIAAQKKFNLAQKNLNDLKADPTATVDQIQQAQSNFDQAQKGLNKIRQGMELLEDFLRDYHHRADPWLAALHEATGNFEAQRSIFMALAPEPGH